MPNAGSHRLTIETVGDVSRLICSHCQRPFLELENGEMIFESKHGSAKHENVLTGEHLRMVAVELYRQMHPPERW